MSDQGQKRSSNDPVVGFSIQNRWFFFFLSLTQIPNTWVSPLPCFIIMGFSNMMRISNKRGRSTKPVVYGPEVRKKKKKKKRRMNVSTASEDEKR